MIFLFNFVSQLKNMKRIFSILSIYLLLINRCYAIDLTRTVGGRAAAMGRTSVAERSIWSIQNNPAGLALMQGWHFGLYYENQWLLKETAFKSGAMARHWERIGTFGLSVSQFGGSDYNENKFGIAYARDFGPYLQMGLQIDYLLLHWGEAYPNRGALGLELGIQSQVTTKLRLGAYLFNPFRIRFKTLNDDPLPIVMRFGLAYQFSENFIGQCEVEKASDKTGIHLRSGFEYAVFKRFFIRAGAQYNPNLLSFGAGYMTKHLNVDVSAQMHQALGASIQIGIGYDL